MEREFNNDMLNKAEAIRYIRAQSLINEEFGFLDKTKQKADFLAYFKKKCRSKDQKWTFVYQPYICWKTVGRNLAFAIVKGGIFLTAPASFISAGECNNWILDYLCSNVGKYFIYKNSDTTCAGDDIMLNIQSLIKFPITHGLCVPTDLNNAQKQIWIYSVYGFTQDEIKYIEYQL